MKCNSFSPVRVGKSCFRGAEATPNSDQHDSGPISTWFSTTCPPCVDKQAVLWISLRAREQKRVHATPAQKKQAGKDIGDDGKHEAELAPKHGVAQH